MTSKCTAATCVTHGTIMGICLLVSIRHYRTDSSITDEWHNKQIVSVIEIRGKKEEKAKNPLEILNSLISNSLYIRDTFLRKNKCGF